jgi:drug/metabolite transporter (DMT)-like permease
MIVSKKKNNAPSSLAIWAAMITVYMIWGSTYLAIRFAIETIPPFLMAGTRFLIAGIILYLIRRARGDAKPSCGEWRSATTIGILLLVGGNGGVVWAEQKVASGVAALLVGVAPLWMALIDVLHPAGRRPSRWAILGLALGFVGIGVLVGPSQMVGHGEDVDLVGAMVLILAALSWAVGSLYSRQAPLPSSPLLWTAMEMLAGGAGLFLLGLLTEESGQLDLATISSQSLMGMAYLIVFGSWVGLTSYTWLFRVAPTPLVATYAYVNPVVAVLLGHFLAAEALTAQIVIAATIVVGSVALTTISQQASIRSKSSHLGFQSMECDRTDKKKT